MDVLDVPQLSMRRDHVGWEVASDGDDLTWTARIPLLLANKSGFEAVIKMGVPPSDWSPCLRSEDGR